MCSAGLLRFSRDAHLSSPLSETERRRRVAGCRRHGLSALTVVLLVVVLFLALAAPALADSISIRVKGDWHPWTSGSNLLVSAIVDQDPAAPENQVRIVTSKALAWVAQVYFDQRTQREYEELYFPDVNPPNNTNPTGSPSAQYVSLDGSAVLSEGEIGIDTAPVRRRKRPPSTPPAAGSSTTATRLRRGYSAISPPRPRSCHLRSAIP